MIGTIYRPPSEPIGYWDRLDGLLHSAITPGRNVILCGDLNVNVDPSTAPDHQLHFLSDLTASYSLHQGVHQRTRFASNSTATTLDLFFNTFDQHNVATIHPVAFSDHAAVQSEFYLDPTRSPKTSMLCRNYRRINHESFKADLIQQNFCSIEGSPTDMWTEWNNRFLQVLDTHAPLRYCKQHKRRSVPWMDSQLLHLLSKRNRLHRKWLSDRSEQRYATFKAARREATTCNRKLKEAYYSTKFQLATCDVKQTWRIINQLTGKQRKSAPLQCSAEAIRSAFAKIVEDPSRPVHLHLPQGPRTATSFVEFVPVSIAKVRKLLEQQNPTKATGSDGIPAALLRAHADVLAPSLALLFNKSMREGHFPAPMKVASISPLFKGGDPSIAKNHRPVSLMSIVSKLLEQVIHDQLTQYLCRHDLFPPTQFGYRSHHSTCDALVLAVEGICQAQTKKYFTGIAFVDMSKAFDKVKHQTLIQDLFEVGIGGTVLQWLADYLSDGTQYVKVGQVQSSPYTSFSGVPQGSVLGPLLFVLYVRDIAKELSPYNVATLQFADDISQHEHG